MSVVRSLSSGANFKFAVVGGQLVVQDKDNASGRTYTVPTITAEGTLSATTVVLTSALTVGVTGDATVISSGDIATNGSVSALGSSGALNIGGALNHDGTTVGFYGTVPIAKQSGVAVTAGGIHAALVALGLIAA